MRRRQRRVVVRFSDNGPLTFPRLLDVVADAAIDALTHDAGLRSPEVRGKIETCRAQLDFLQQNRRSRKRKTGVWSADLDFSPHFRNRPSEVCGKFRNPRAHRPFRAEKPQVKALRHPGVLGMFRICRILPFFASVAGRVHLYHRLDNGQNSQFRIHTKKAGRGEIAPAGVGLPACAVSARAEARIWTLTPPWAPRPARCGRVRMPRRWLCPCRSTCSRPGDRRRSRRPPAPPAPRTACRGPRSWRR